MKYVPPLGSANPNAPYTDPVEGAVPAAAVEQPMREIASVISSMGLVPSETDLSQLDQAIDMKVAAVQPDLSECVGTDRSIATTAPLTGGGSLGADLTLSVSAASAATPDHMVLRDGAGRAQTADPSTAADIATKGYTDSSLRALEASLKAYVDSLYASTVHYEVCEFYYFRNPTLRPGFLQAQGELLENAAALYPDAWAFLQTAEGQRLCITEAAWQSMSQATWATLADGTTVGWNGIGGVPFYVQDTATGSLRLPDLRGMYAEAAGFDGLEAGGSHGDAIRQMTGIIADASGSGGNVLMRGVSNHPGVLYATASSISINLRGTGSLPFYFLHFDASRMVPVAGKTQPRAWGALACVYLGPPAA